MGSNNRKWKLSEGFYSNLLLVLAGIGFYMVVSRLDIVTGCIGQVFAVLSPFIAGAALAYLLDFIARAIERGPLRGQRGVCVALAYLIAVLGVGLLLMLIVPQLVESVRTLISNVPSYLQSAENYVNQLLAYLNLQPEELEKYMGSYKKLVEEISNHISDFVPQVLDYGKAIGSGLLSAVTALISSIYMLLDKHKLLGQLKKISFVLLSEANARRLLRVCHQANNIFGSFISGKILDSLIIGVICFVLTSILRIPYALLVSVIVGCTNVIPFFGPFLGAVPCSFILLIVNPISALEFIILILVLQQFDGNILGPKILGNSTGLSALWVLFAIIVGGDLFGFVGMLVGVPCFAVLYSLAAEGMDILLARKGIDAKGDPVGVPSSEDYIDLG